MLRAAEDRRCHCDRQYYYQKSLHVISPPERLFFIDFEKIL